MKEIKLKSGMIAFVDDDDFHLANSYIWSSEKHGTGFRVVRKNCITKNGEWESKNAKLHRFILKAKKGQIIDHIDGNALNNQKSNLRFCTHKQNIANTGSRKNSSSKYLGVSKRPTKTMGVRWLAQIQEDGKSYSIGVYESDIEAALAYNCAASFRFREFARLNVV